MSNYSISINLLKVKNTAIKTIQGKTKPVRCVIIPLEGLSNLVENEHGIFLNMGAWASENQKFGNTHYVKVNISKEEQEAMTEEQRKQQPIVGNMKPIVAKQTTVPESTKPETPVTVEGEDDLPF
jgi:hypothetical protein